MADLRRLTAIQKAAGIQSDVHMAYYKALPADLRRLSGCRFVYTRKDLVSVALAAFCGGVMAITLIYAVIVKLGGPGG